MAAKKKPARPKPKSKSSKAKKKPLFIERVICAGFGGQGIMFMGRLIAHAAMSEKKETTWLPSYGAEVRGGTAHSMVVVSNEPVASPVVVQPDTAIVMNRPSFEKFKDRVAPGGLLMVNSTLVDEEVKRKDIDVLRVPLTDIARKLGNTRVANMVALGMYSKRKRVISLKSALHSLGQLLPPDKQDLQKMNEQAIREGAKKVRGPR